MSIIATRQDLDRLAGTPEHKAFILRLKDSLTRKQNTATYPEDYNHKLRPGQDGYIAPDFEDVEDLSLIQKYGFTKEEILALAESPA